ncbi:MAG TPA: hypothetical protein VM285_00680 [Polyangia bacterium]|nr:hypothetical protein [Polyangia bacterium]
MKRHLVPAVLLVACSMFLANCSSSSSDEPAAPTPTTFSTNISGTWSGTTTFFGSPTAVTLAVTQPTSDSAVALGLTGMLSLNNGAPLAVSGTKDGDAWTVSGNNGTTILTIRQTLTSATASTGDLTLQVGPPSNKGTVPLDLTKS